MTAVVPGMSVAPVLRGFVDDVLAVSPLPAPAFWSGLRDILTEFGPRVDELLAERDRRQHAIDRWHIAHPGAVDPRAYQAELARTGYLNASPAPASAVTTARVPAAFTTAAPQLVVPVTNARYALNAVNARWGSLYDALYGTDALFDSPPADAERQARADEVVGAVRGVLDRHIPLATGSHVDVTGYAVVDGALRADLSDGTQTGLADPGAFLGFDGPAESPSAIVVHRHGLRALIRIDPESPVGRRDRAGVSDVLLESAVTAIVDLEDSVATVDAEDKVLGYANWWGLCRGDLTTSFDKDGRTVTRGLVPDIPVTTADGRRDALEGRAEMLVRVVGLHLRTDAVTMDGAEVCETLVDAVIAVLCGTIGAGRSDALPVVVPKLHGPEEVALIVDLFARIEALLGLSDGTLLLGLMDEERRTSANLRHCVAVAATRLVFINTGFLDRSGDEIHTDMHAGVLPPKAQLRTGAWMTAYEERNVRAGLDAGLAGRGQIGKGMWALPQAMRRMREEKIAQPESGATTGWVPSPSAATLHALHYWEVDVAERHVRLARADVDEQATLTALLTPPVVDAASLDAEVVQAELDGNVQSILGYVVRWVDQGVGCSTVPDLAGVGLMEDRATLRISSQLIANWLLHGIVSPATVDEAFDRMAAVVDAQNAADPGYRPMHPDLGTNIAFQAARELVFDGVRRPNGYTESVLHRARRAVKAAG